MPPSHRTHGTRNKRTLSAAAILIALSAAAVSPAQAATSTFLFTGAQQQFVVPAGVTSVHVLAVGGAGGSGVAPGGGAGGPAAEVSGDLEVLPGQTLYVEVGGTGIGAEGFGSEAFDGGSYGGDDAGGGGGASDVRLLSRPATDTPQSLFSRVIVAGGGGGGGAGISGTTGGAGGAAGSAGGAASVGTSQGGTAGTGESGGIGCGGMCNGKLGSGTQGSVIKVGTKGGGGGAGLFGGGGAEDNGNEETGGSGGGGGSSLQPADGKTVIPAAAAAPEVQITYSPPSPPTPPATVPSNAFTLLRPIIAAGRSITLVLDLPGSGSVAARATTVREVTIKKHGKRLHRKVRFTFATAHASATTGAVELTLKPTTAGRKALAAHKPMSVALTVTFTPSGGTAASKTASLKLPRR